MSSKENNWDWCQIDDARDICLVFLGLKSRAYAQVPGNAFCTLDRLKFHHCLQWFKTMHPSQSPIAIIGVGCRLPGGASDLDTLWQLLSEGRSGRTEIPKDRWHAEEWFDPYPEAKQSMVTKHGFFVQGDISLFDAKFFGVSSTEAHSMDP